MKYQYGNIYPYHLSHISTLTKSLYDILTDICNNIYSDTNIKVGFRLEKESEFSVEYTPYLCLLAPCGCCENRPFLKLEDSYESLIEKIKKLKEADSIVRNQIDEYSNMYGIDFNIDDEDDWNKSSEELANEFIKEYNEFNEYVENIGDSDNYD